MATKLNNPYPDKNKNEWKEETEYLSNGKRPGMTPKAKKVWKVLRPILTFVISIGIVAGIVFGAFNYVKGHFFDPVDVNDSTGIEITIPKYASLNTITNILHDNDLIRNKQVFKLYTDFSDMGDKLKAGTYTLSKNMTFDDIIYTLQEGNVAAEEVETQFIEGRTAETYGQKLVDEYGITKNTKHYIELITTGGDFVNQYPFLAEAKAANDAQPEGMKRKYLLEGYLFPDKYRNYTDASEEDIIKKQLDQFDKKFTEEYRARAAELGMTVDQVVTLASIIEKEASKKEYFSKVSAVFHNRLNNQEEYGYIDSDATQAYALGVTGKILLGKEELNKPTPYNTRRNNNGNPGLPTGPIGNPGVEAIKAALYPDEEMMKDGKKYYFFLSTDPKTADMAFTQGIDEFNELKNQWTGAWEAADAKAAGQ